MIWRRGLVPASMTLRELHRIVQVVMGWEGVHLFLFDVHTVQYGSFELFSANPDVPMHQFGFRENDRCQLWRKFPPLGRCKSRPVGAAPWVVMPRNSKHVPSRIGR